MTMLKTDTEHYLWYEGGFRVDFHRPQWRITVADRTVGWIYRWSHYGTHVYYRVEIGDTELPAPDADDVRPLGFMSIESAREAAYDFLNATPDLEHLL
jgi:hypothetical protein